MKSNVLHAPLSFSDASSDSGSEAKSRQLPRLPSWLGRIARSRLAQFIVIGCAIFGISSFGRNGSAITLTRSDLDARRDAELAKRTSAKSADEISVSVAERALEDEILYREGVKLGFDRNDAIVRQRVIQKTLFLAEELAGASDPATDAELRAFYEQTRERWRRPERWKLVQVFARERATLDAASADARSGNDQRLAAIGEACQVPRETTLTRAEIEATLGAELANALPKAPSAVFVGPLKSALGWHLVRVVAHDPERQSSFDEAKGSLRGLYAVRKRSTAVAAYLDRAFREYDVRIDGERVTSLHPNGRIAVRKSGSAED